MDPVVKINEKKLKYKHLLKNFKQIFVIIFCSFDSAYLYELSIKLEGRKQFKLRILFLLFKSIDLIIIVNNEISVVDAKEII